MSESRPIIGVRWLLFAVAAMTLAVAVPAMGQESSVVINGPAGRYEVDVPAPVRIERGDGWIRIVWDGSPGPLPPIPPGPTPEPDPIPIPTQWGPLARIIVVYESSNLTGRDVLMSTTFREALSTIAPKGADDRPLWRIWDKDLDVSREPEWVAAMDKAKTEFSGDKPILFGVDDSLRVRAIPLDGLTDAEAVEKVQSLKEPAK